MSVKFCSSCGRESAAEKFYCVHCGGILGVAQKIGTDGDTTTPSSFSKKVPISKRGGVHARKSLIFRLVQFTLILLFATILLISFLFFTQPNDQLLSLPSVPIPNAPTLVARSISHAKNIPSGLSQLVINAFLQARGKFEWKTPIKNIPTPEWKGSSVVLKEGEFTYQFEVIFLGHPLLFSETFKFSKTHNKQNIEAISGSVGAFVISRPFFPLLTQVMAVSTLPITPELEEINSFSTIQIHSGLLEFSNQ